MGDTVGRTAHAYIEGMVGKRYGLLVVHDVVPGDRQGWKARVRCDCGWRGWKVANHLRQGKAKACGKNPECRKAVLAMATTHPITEADEIGIRKGRAEGRSLAELGREFNVAPSSVWKMFH